MRLTHLFRTAHPAANLLAAISLGLLLLKLVLLNRYPAPVTVIADLGLVAEAILASIVASYVFYLLVVHLKEVTDKATVYPYVRKHCSRVVGSCRQQLGAITGASGVSLALETASSEVINEAFTRLHPYGEAPMIIFPNTTANWLQYLEHGMHTTRRGLDRVLSQLPYLDAKLVAKLVAIDECSHFEHLALMGSAIPVRNKDLTAWATSFAQYVELCRELESHIGPSTAEDAA